MSWLRFARTLWQASSCGSATSVTSPAAPGPSLRSMWRGTLLGSWTVKMPTVRTVSVSRAVSCLRTGTDQPTEVWPIRQLVTTSLLRSGQSVSRLKPAHWGLALLLSVVCKKYTINVHVHLSPPNWFFLLWCQHKSGYLKEKQCIFF